MCVPSAPGSGSIGMKSVLSSSSLSEEGFSKPIEYSQDNIDQWLDYLGFLQEDGRLTVENLEEVQEGFRAADIIQNETQNDRFILLQVSAMSETYVVAGGVRTAESKLDECKRHIREGNLTEFQRCLDESPVILNQGIGTLFEGISYLVFEAIKSNHNFSLDMLKVLIKKGASVLYVKKDNQMNHIDGTVNSVDYDVISYVNFLISTCRDRGKLRILHKKRNFLVDAVIRQGITIEISDRVRELSQAETKDLLVRRCKKVFPIFSEYLSSASRVLGFGEEIKRVGKSKLPIEEIVEEINEFF